MVKPENPYSHTVLLPETSFPMKAGLSEREPLQIRIWKEQKIFQRMRDRNPHAPEFCLHDGPPYANGNFHLGHALNKILKDIIVKSQSLMGKRVDMIPGWDCHGLPIEVQVLKNLGEKAKHCTPSELRKQCRDYAAMFVKKQGEDLDRFLCFWDNERIYQTMSSDYEAKIVEIFGELFQRGYIYKGKKPVYWCIELATAHAEAEIEYKEHVSPSIYVRFPVKGEETLGALIWTTTPWTLPANLAIAFNRDLEYSVFRNREFGDLIFANGLKESIQTQTGLQFERIRAISNKELEKLVFRHPFLDRDSIPVFGSHVTLEAGTGVVHTAPGHGTEDYKVGLEYGLEPFSPVDPYGRYTEEFPLMQGKTIFQANPEIVEILREKKALLHASEFVHSYPHSWRSKKPLIFRATPQWFFSMDHKDLRKKALEAIETVRWIPDWGIARIRSMVESRPDWCLSRQRNWGVPIPSFTCQDCKSSFINNESIRYFTNLVKEKGIEVWFQSPAEELLPPGSRCESCGSTNLKQDNDILDVWFDSGISSFVVYPETTNRPPADLYLEGSDQHRGWFQSSLWPSMAIRGFPPYRSVLTHGYILDESGRAMSKSLGNGIDPITDVIQIYGADVLRLWVSTLDFRDDVKAGKDLIKNVADSYRKIRNTFRYLLGNTAIHTKTIEYEDMTHIDRYYLSRTAHLCEELRKAYSQYQFHLVYQKIVHFCTVDLSQDYFEMIRDRMYCDDRNSLSRNSSATALKIILKSLDSLISPILSFTAEEVYKEAGFGESVFLENFPDLSSYRDLELEEDFQNYFAIREDVQKALEIARMARKIGKSLEAKVHIVPKVDWKSRLPWKEEDWEMFLVVSQVEFQSPLNSSPTLYAEWEGEAAKVYILDPETPECPRCWRHTRDIGEDGLCSRCVEVVGKLSRSFS